MCHATANLILISIGSVFSMFFNFAGPEGLGKKSLKLRLSGLGRSLLRCQNFIKTGRLPRLCIFATLSTACYSGDS